MTEFRLSDAARDAGHRLAGHARLDSTNAEALRLARGGEAGPLWIAARHQSDGRGRRGAAWASPAGNLAATLLFPLTGIAPEHVPTLGFVAGLALVRSLEDVSHGTSPPPCGEEMEVGVAQEAPHRHILSDPYSSPREGRYRSISSPTGGGGREADGGGGAPWPVEALPTPPRCARSPSPRGRGEASVLNRQALARIGTSASPRGEGDAAASPFLLKWPNDVLAGGAKLAGLLLEAEGRSAVAIGFGVNVASAPSGLPYPATALARIGIETDAMRLLAALSARFVEAARLWDEGRGFPAIRRAWLARAAGIGAPVSVRIMDRTVGGIFEEIDEGGRLVILAPDGTRQTVTAGEVHFGQAATAA